MKQNMRTRLFTRTWFGKQWSFFGLATFLLCSTAMADLSDPACEKALAPRITKDNTNSTKHQTYVYENAERDYEELKKTNDTSTSFGGSYAGYGAEFGQSNSGSDFSKRVRDRLKKEGYVNDSTDARSYYRVDLTSEQLAAWTACVSTTSQSNTPAVLLSPSRVTNGGFAVTMKYRYGNTPPGKQPSITSRDGTISNVQAGLNYGDSKTSFDVAPKSSTQRFVSVKANLNGGTDDIIVDLRPKTLSRAKQNKQVINLQAKDLSGSGYMAYIQELDLVCQNNSGPENASWQVNAATAGMYRLEVLWASARPAAGEPPLIVWLHTQPTYRDRVPEYKFEPKYTGGFDPAHLAWHVVTDVDLPARPTTLTFSRPDQQTGRIPCIRALRLTQQ